jgi:hypothetical protein
MSFVDLSTDHIGAYRLGLTGPQQHGCEEAATVDIEAVLN